MNTQTIVAVFDNEAHAAAAVADLETAGIPAHDITRHAGNTAGSASTGTVEPRTEQSFWSSLFGGEPDNAHDTTVYDRSLQSGSVVVTVRARDEQYERVTDIFERHEPIDIDERAAGYTTGTDTGMRISEYI